LFSINEYQTPTRKQLRSFGLILGAGFCIIGTLPVVFRHASPHVWALVLSVFFALTGVLIPELLRHIHRVWMTAGNILGLINSKILLSLLFFLVVTPVRLFMSLTSRDPMNRKFDKKSESYRVVRKPRPVSHMKHQF